MKKPKQYALAATAGTLTMEQVGKLVAWRGWHNGDYFSYHTKEGQWLEMNLRGLLALYNASSDYDGLGSWLSDVKGAAKTYRKICADKLNWAVTQ